MQKMRRHGFGDIYVIARLNFFRNHGHVRGVIHGVATPEPSGDAPSISQIAPHNLWRLREFPRNNDLTAVVGLFDITGWLEVLDIECIPCIREDCGTCDTQALRSTLFRQLNSLLK